jgi:hypothetical protein
MSRQTGLRRRHLARLHLRAMLLALTIDAGGVSAELRPVFAGSLAAVMQAVDSNAAVLVANQITFAVEDIEGVAGQDVPVKITLPQAAELASSDASLGAFILIRNIPAGVTLSAGIASGRIWVLPLRDVAELRLVAAPDVVGTFSIEFNLIGLNNKRLAQQTVHLNLMGFDVLGRVGTTGTLAGPEKIGKGEAAIAPVPPAAKPALQEEAELLKRGEKLLRQGGIAAARIIFEELAQEGSPKGALALARSYDPAYIPNSRTSTLTPDLNKALEWYRRADELGSAEARQRIAEIGFRR